MKKRLLPLLCGFFIYVFILSNFIYFLSTTKNSTFVPSDFFTTAYESTYYDDATANVGTFITDNDGNIENSIIDFMNTVFNLRNEAFLNGNVEKLYKFYDINQTFSAYSLKHEFKRIAYLRDWAKERNLTFKSIESTPTIKDFKIKDNLYHLILSEEYKFIYFYNDNPEKITTFGIELIHNLELKDKDSSFLITKDYYEDYFKTGLEKYDFDLTEKNIPLTNTKAKVFNFNTEANPISSENYNRLKAVSYANKYSGISFASKAENNMSYSIYVTGDKNSANFISQCLSDRTEGGGMKQDKDWSYMNTKSNKIKATSSWVKSQDLVEYLLNSEKGSLYFSGTLETLKDTKINLGDLIIFKSGNYIDGIGIITDFDSNNYPLINTNSINTYKTPFDLGFGGTDSKFYLLSIK
mgnify:CR=1 FL=1